MAPKVSVIIPIHNGKKDTLKCLKSLSRLNYPKKNLEIIVIDNASSDDSVSSIRNSFFSMVRQPHYPEHGRGILNPQFIVNKTNLGFAKAVNQGIKKAKGKLIFVINNDIIFEKYFLLTLTDYLAKNPQVGIIGGKIYYSKPKNELLYQGLTFNSWTGSINRQKRPERLKETQWVQGCAMLIDKKVVEKIGIFDHGFFFSYEDADYCLRARKAGFKIIYNPKAVGWHKESASIDRFGLRRKAEELYKGKFRYIFKNSTIPQIIISTLIQFFVIAPIRTLIIRKPPFFLGSMLVGFLYNLKNLAEISKLRGVVKI